MKIVVCAKQVPDTTEVKLDPKTNTLIRDGVPSIINPDDKAGIEAALQLKEKVGGTVTVISMGPPQADAALREALAMGCDDAILVTDRAFGGADTWATSSTIAAALKKLDFDVIITGRQAIDGDTAQVGPQIAEHLGIPQVSYAEEILEASEDKLVVKRQFEDRYHVIEIKTPCLITALSELATPRYMTVHGIFDAYREKEVKVLSRAVTEITHNHPEGIKGAEAVAMAIFLALSGASKKEIKDRMILYYPSIERFNFNALVKNYKDSDICENTVNVAIYCFLRSNSLEDAIRNAIAIGGDCDTIAAISGSIAEAYFSKNLPSKFEDEFMYLMIDPDVEKIVKDFHTMIGSKKFIRK